jgi:hypothetical protein
MNTNAYEHSVQELLFLFLFENGVYQVFCKLNFTNF